MKRTVLIVFIMSLLLTACGEGAENNQTSTESEPATTEAVETNNTSNVENDDLVNNADQNDNAPHNETKHENNEQNTNDEDEKDTDDKQLAQLTVHYIDADQADATLFHYADGDKTYDVLFDAGDWNRTDVVNYLNEQHIDMIDLIIISHPHADHIGQLATIMEQFDVGEVWFSGNTSSSKTFQKALDAVMASDADYYEPRAGETFDVGPLQIEILHPSTLTGELNEDSISARFTYGTVRFLFTGDAYQNEELAMMNRDIHIDADILQLGHHGSKTSTHPDFLQAVQPDIAIYSAGAGNSYGHPHADVVSRIKSADIDLYGTDVHGTIQVTTDGDSYDLTTTSDGTVTPGQETDKDNPTDEEENNKAQPDTVDETEQKQNEETNDSSALSDCVDLNSASIEAVQEIIHIGPVRAEDVIAQRPFNSVDDLTKINGIGPARIEDIKAEGKACVH